MQAVLILIAFIILPIIAFTTYEHPFGELASAGSSYTSVTAGMTDWAAIFEIISYAAIGLDIPGTRT